MGNGFLVVGLLILTEGARAAEPRFVDRAPPLGIVHAYTGGWEHFVGGGVAVFDCDGDAFADLYVAGGSSPAVLLRNRTEIVGAELQFETLPAGILGVTGAYPLDFDSDGILDLFVLRVGENSLLKGMGDCAFEDITADYGVGGDDRWSTAFSATWEPGAGLPTLAVGNYVDRSDPEGPFEACDVNAIYRPAQVGEYTIVLLDPGYCSLSMLFSDWARQGRQDLRISNDRHYYVMGGFEELWRLDPRLRRFEEQEGWGRLSIWGMGIASRDITGDGLPEVYLTSMGDQLLQYRDGAELGPVWRDAAYAQGATAHRPYVGDDGRPSTGWHAQFGDVDNDGRDDIFVAKGNVDQMPGNASADPNNLLLQQVDGTFQEFGAEADLASTARARGAAVVDLNMDGLLDVVVVNRRSALEIYENVTKDAGNWLLLDAGQAGVNTGFVGGWIEVRGGGRTWVREITVGGGHASGQAGFQHFGLGDVSYVDVRLVPPEGSLGEWLPVKANQRLRLIWEGKTRVVPVVMDAVEFPQ